ncbi:hypothetical protein LZ24_01029 [Desulfobotulus alkaliphilus]|uniref:Uncharacterized protein n=1 Tax=Desulfobotulus alkaliphilus TaxID=622671 RepID=A0A562RZP2_9BACT|nr:hypothetical protein LZ24_01029 [Desulfobotulus alkaliphilus]
MKKNLFPLLITLLFFSTVSPSVASPWTGNLNFTLGSKVLDEDDWRPLDEHGLWGSMWISKKRTGL